ncbi:hypothetical protein [Ligaoa zhengdingensis]|uniref:hypothetical protein n=1 Tax=Ligaoa zhengdingensis TaxID=2763658 RepID=UPI0031BAE0E4
MKIKTTLNRLTPEQAEELAKHENLGLLGVLLYKLGRKPIATTVLKVNKFYYPYYVAGAVLTFKRAAKLPSRQMVGMAVMEGAFGVVQDMRGKPDMLEKDVPAGQVVACKYDREKAELQIGKFLANKGYRKYRSIPQVDFREMDVIYKPHYACLCQKGKKKFYRIIDAEIRERNYMLDIKYKELTFMDEEPGEGSAALAEPQADNQPGGTVRGE